jgi:hypothetical protein
MNDLPRHPANPEPTLDDVAAEFPHWHVWRGIAGLVYARKPLTSPPVVLRGEDPTDLRDQINGYLGRHLPPPSVAEMREIFYPDDPDGRYLA